jgi:hypothetical protein
MAARERCALAGGALCVLLSWPGVISAAIYPMNAVTFAAQPYGSDDQVSDGGVIGIGGALAPLNPGIPPTLSADEQTSAAVFPLLVEPDRQTHRSANVLRAGWTTSAEDDSGCAIDTTHRRLTPKFLLVILIFGGLVRFLTSRTYLNFLAEVLDPKSF